MKRRIAAIYQAGQSTGNFHVNKDQRGYSPVLFREYISQMRLVVIFVAASMILGVTASALILMQKGSTQTATATSTIYIASGTQEVSSPPARAPVSQTAQAAGSEASPFILQANVDTQSGSRTAVMQDPCSRRVSASLRWRPPSAVRFGRAKLEAELVVPQNAGKD
jgi:hypothetical protein